MTLFYIDDDFEDRDFFKDAVRQIDPAIMCSTAKDGADGLRELQEMIVMPDFIFLDVNMPVMNGKQFLLEIKKRPRLRSIPIVIYSTTTHPTERAEFLKLGAYKVLAKPSSITNISGLIKSVIDGVNHAGILIDRSRDEFKAERLA